MYGQKEERKKKPSADDPSGHASKIVIDIVEIRTQTSPSALPQPPEAPSRYQRQKLRAGRQRSCHSIYGHK